MKASNVKEVGVKHIQISNNDPVAWSGEVWRNPATGRIQINLNSGTYAERGSNPGWRYTEKNIAHLKRSTERLLGEPVDVVETKANDLVVPGR